MIGLSQFATKFFLLLFRKEILFKVMSYVSGTLLKGGNNFAIIRVLNYS